MKKVLLLLIRSYKKLLSPFLGRNCRFYPSCSDYCHEAIDKHGVFKGCYLGVRRIVKCGPWHRGGVDKVP